MADPVIDKFVGKGITFPIQLDSTGAAVVEGSTSLVRKSIITILSWPIGTRFFLNEFGSKLEEILEEPNDKILAALIKTFIIDAIAEWDKRVELTDINVLESTDTKVNILLSYQIKNTQIQDSFVFPFYRELKF